MSQALLGVVSSKHISRIRANEIRVASLSIAAALFFSVVAPVALVAAETDDANANRSVAGSSEVGQTLQAVPGVLEASDQVVTSSDADSAATATTNGTIVDVPKDAERGVTFGAEAGPKLDITLPNAEAATAAHQVAPGVTGYDAGDGSTSAVQPTEDGGVRMLIIIDNPNAPTAYDYKVTVPAGGQITLMPDGGAAVFGAGGETMATVATPWAKDAIGQAVDTYFTTDGQTLTQHVKHMVPGTVYPVTADPFWSVFGSYFGCILGIGVPMGAAVVIASFPPSWYWINRLATGTVMSGRVNGLMQYASWVRARCAMFIRS
jgi:hypothetical protein